MEWTRDDEGQYKLKVFKKELNELTVVMDVVKTATFGDLFFPEDLADFYEKYVDENGEINYEDLKDFISNVNESDLDVDDITSITIE